MNVLQKILWVAAAAVLAVFASVNTARADTITKYSLTADNCSSGCGSGPFGTVTLDQVDANTVKVTFTLAGSDVFAITGSGSPFGFNVNEAVTSSAVTSTSGMSFAVGGPGSFAGGEGTFSGIVTCSNCGNGTSGMVGGSITFTLTSLSGLSASNFVTNADGYVFAADVGVVVNGVVTGTGPVGSLVETPEPSTISLFGAGLAGLLGLAFVSRRRSE